MSAFVIDTNTMHRVLRGIYMQHPLYERGTPIIEQMASHYMASGHPLSITPTDLGRKLYAMNIEAVMQRYPDCRDDPSGTPGPEDAERLGETYEAPATLRSIPWNQAFACDALKAMECLSYQCSEGNVPETELFGQLKQAINRLALVIVETLPAYKNASWG